MRMHSGKTMLAGLFLLMLAGVSPANPVSAQSAPAPIKADPQAQPDPPAQPESQTAKVNRRIGLDVVVTDTSGKTVAGLAATNFTVLDNGQPAKLASFLAVDAPSSAGTTAKPDEATQILILIDTVNSSLSSVAYQRQEVETFLKKNEGKLDYPVSLFFFNGDGAKRIAPGSNNGMALADALEKESPNLHPIPRAQGFYGAVDRIQLSLGALSSLAQEEGRLKGRKVLIWLSPGWALLPRTDATSDHKQATAVFQSIVSMSTLLRQARVTLYCIDPIRSAGGASLNWYRYESYLKPVSKINNADLGNLSLQVLSRQSGGDAVGFGSDYISGLIGKIVAGEDNYYYLSFVTPPADQKDVFHALKITVDKPGLTVHTRVGYYDQP